MMEDMYAVMTRINEIKKRFGVGRRAQAPVREQGFQAELASRIDASRDIGNGPGRAAELAGTGARRNLTKPEILAIAHENAAKKGVPGNLVTAMIEAESSFNPRAVSKKGARGLMQLMPAVLDEMGVADPFSPEENIRAGVGVMKRLLEKYDMDYRKALAAYNAGERAVDEHGGVPPYGETAEYVNRVISSYLKNSE